MLRTMKYIHMNSYRWKMHLNIKQNMEEKNRMHFCSCVKSKDKVAVINSTCIV